MFFNLIIIWSLSHNLYNSKGTKLQSWNSQNLSTVPLDLDVRLRTLDLSNNFIRQLHRLALPYLEQLDLSNNQLDLISEEAFENLARLEHLNLSRNGLNINVGSNSEALQPLKRLRSLDISRNSLSNDAVELYLRRMSSLDLLKMSGNALTRLSRSLFRETMRLRTLIINDNFISEIDPGTFESMTQLETLNLAKNNLAQICDFKLYQVKYLNLSRNSVEFFVTPENDQTYNLEILDLSYNKLLYFPIVPKRNNLRYLYLQSNLIGSLRTEAAMVSEANSLYSMIVKETVVMKNNLHAIWRQMPLFYIDLSYNHFTSFPLETLSLIPSLEIVHFSNNCLQSIDWNIRNYSDSGLIRQLVFPSLKHLDLQSNSLQSISPFFLKALAQIETLNLQENFLQPCASAENVSTSCFALGQLRTLKHLNLRENNIKMLQPKTFLKTSLVSLNLAKNQHMEMCEGALDGVRATLRNLIVSDINMSSSHLYLPCMPALTQLNISNNGLNKIPISLGCSPLKEIDLRKNEFTTLDHSLISILSKNLSVMFISGNHFDCCNSEWMNALNEMKIILPDINKTKCFTLGQNLMMTDYLKSPLLHCLLHKDVQKVNFGQMTVIVLFLVVLLTTLILLSRKMCCTQKSFMV